MRLGARLVTLTGACVAAACASESAIERAPSATLGALSVYDAYAPASAADDVGSAYFTVVNQGAAADTLMHVTVPSGTGHLHNVITENERTRMSPVDMLPVPAHGSLRMAPGRYHVMLSGLPEPFEVGDTIHVELVFARAGTLQLPVVVLTYSEVSRLLETTESAYR
jgi:copper(I)-binding protein